MHDNKRTGYDKTVRNPRPRTLKRKNPNYSVTVPGAPPYARWSSLSQLLPQLEQGTLAAAIDFRFPPETPDVGGYGSIFLPAYQDPGRQNSTASQVQVATFSSVPPTPRAWAIGRGEITMLPTKEPGCAT